MDALLSCFPQANYCIIHKTYIIDTLLKYHYLGWQKPHTGQSHLFPQTKVLTYLIQ